MSQYRRAFAPGGVFFFTLVTYRRAPFFLDPGNIQALREAIRRVKASRPFSIDAMVILPDHLHCIIRLPEGDADYSGRWREIKKASSRTIAPAADNRRERHVWQRRFWEHLIRDETDWRRHIDYIHYNPVRHGLASSPGEWPWSSFQRALAHGWYAADWGIGAPDTIRGMEVE